MAIERRGRRLGRAAAVPLLVAAALAGCAGPAALLAGPGRESIPDRAVQTPGFVAVVVQPGQTLSSLAATWLKDPARGWEIAEYNGLDEAVPGQELAIPLRPFRRGGLTPESYQTVPVLVYHQFAESSTGKAVVSRGAFAAQMQLLKERGYRVVTLGQLRNFLEFRGQLPEKAVVITIDDGWRGTYDIAFPILKQHGYPASLFVYTQLVSGGAKTLSWDQLREMAAAGLDIQCHSVTHRNLAVQRDQESADEYLAAVRREIVDATLTIEKEIGRRPTFLAYPYGETNGLVIALLRNLGYRGAFTVAREPNPFFAPAFRLNRSMIFGDFDLDRFERNLSTTDRRALR